MKKMILLADANSFWAGRYIENVLIPANIEVSILTNLNTDPRNKQFYKENGIKVFSLFESTWYGKIPKLRSWIASAKIKKFLNTQQYDYVNILYVFPSTAKTVSKAKIKGELIATYLGSDLLRVKAKVTRQEHKMIERADHIVVMTSDLKRAFVSRFGEAYESKIHIINSGNSAFGEINKKRDQKADCKQRIAGKENAGKKIVTIGNNASDRQQHLDVVKSLNALSVQEKDNVHIVLPMTYRNHNPEYINHLKEYVINSGFSYTFLETFMNDEEIAALCVATDIYINAQVTDAFSGAMLEQIYAGTYILNADWLKYQPLEDMQIFCDQFREFSEIPDKVRNFDFSDGTVTTEYIKKLDKYCSWESCAASWKKDVFHI